MKPKATINTNYMKRFIAALVAITVIASSCGDGKKDKISIINDKKVQLQKLKTQQQKLNQQSDKNKGNRCDDRNSDDL